jgi:hypothetical protein
MQVNHSRIHQRVSPDPIIFLALLVILAASSVIFFISIQRETIHRAQMRLAEWAEQNRFSNLNAEFGPPRPLDRVNPPMRMTVGLYNRNTRLVHVRSAAPDPGEPPLQWNLAIRLVPTLSPPVGLRSADAMRSIVDLFKLEPSPRQSSKARFVIVGEDLVASHKMADGSSRALLPADLSLLRIDDYLVIDFSGRPFDPIELGRMLGLLDQLATIA